ncbi:MAG: LysR substrate-binding domain-containing protein, partial [Myxococcota bacterium]
PGDLAGHDAIVVAGGAPAALNFSGPDGQREPGVLRGPLVVSTFTEAARLVGLGAGLALLPSYTMNTMSTAAALTTILAEWTLPTVPLTALYPRRNRGALAISLLCEHIRAVLGEVQAR